MTAQSKRLKADEKQTYGPRANSRIPISKTKATRKQNSAKTVGRKEKLSVRKNEQNACPDQPFFWQELGRHCSFQFKRKFCQKSYRNSQIVNCFSYVHGRSFKPAFTTLDIWPTFGFIHLSLGSYLSTEPHIELVGPRDCHSWPQRSHLHT